MNNWISQAIASLKRGRRKVPEEITLHYFRKTWEIICDPNLPSKKACESAHEIYLPVSARHKKEAIILLKQWIQQKAWLHLPQHLSELSAEHKLPFAGLSIRTQKTRWGSCNSEKKISLNCKLLFLPKHLVDYVIIHELCHTKQLNHSSKFWALVEEHMPHYKKPEHEIRHEKNYVPDWFF